MLLRVLSLIFLFWIFIGRCIALINPIEVRGKHFVDSVTNEVFFIKGIDYQPGGSSGFDLKSDPLSDPQSCKRDILLFQDLGINTIRIYSINPELNHDVCMTLLAHAGIYLLLDVNSPLSNQHLNRYEPWTSYTSKYLEHIFKTIKAFSGYPNTLGFFAGNEIVNDKRSASRAPVYVKSLVNDMKLYIQMNAPRKIPVGYSAADDLDYRVPLSKYLECSDSKLKEGEVDFYGINSYQWCGDQDFHSSGYDKLVEAYKSYTKPVFFSEFGCNHILPRTFQEIETLYSKDMYGVFSGGLVYEFSQEANQYGLVRIDGNGDAYLLEDFDNLKNQYNNIVLPTNKELDELILTDNVLNTLQYSSVPPCQKKYENLVISDVSTPNMMWSMVKTNMKITGGKFVMLTKEDMTHPYSIFNLDGKEIMKDAKVNTEVHEDDKILKSVNNNAASTKLNSKITLIVLLLVIIHFR